MANTLKLGAGKWATGTDTVLAFNDENNNFKPLPFDFSRASSATVVNQSGLIEAVGSGEPRIDFQGNTKGALLLEPTRSNLITYSEDFSNWFTNGSATVSINTLTSPNGTLDADTLNAAISNYSGFNKRFTTTIGSPYTNSMFFKKGTQQWVGLIKSNGSAIAAWFNLSNGTIGTVESGVDAKIEDFGNGWYRCLVTMDATITNSYIQVSIVDSNNSISNSLVGGNIYAWGAQVEVGSYATSYIPTSGSAVTRVSDACSQTPPDGVIGQTEGTMFFEIDFANTSGVAGAWSISNGSSANRITMNTTNSSSTEFILSVAQNFNSGSTKLASANVTFSDKHKVAIKYYGTTLKLFIDGQLSDSVATDGFGNYTNFYLGGNQTGVGGDARKFIQADLYNTALTDAELQALTTI